MYYMHSGGSSLLCAFQKKKRERDGRKEDRYGEVRPDAIDVFTFFEASKIFLMPTDCDYDRADLTFRVRAT